MDAPALLLRPIIGGIFGAGRYALATTPHVANGLHSIRYMVVEPTSGVVLSIADEKTVALTSAREMLQASEQLLERLGDEAAQGTLWPAEEIPVRPVVDRARPVSRRRRDIFAKCGGKCFYCARPLQLDGSWHVEHQVARALGGTDAPMNLVTACVPCNLSKRDRTALEFVAAPRHSTGDESCR